MKDPQNQAHSPYSRVLKTSAVKDPDRIYETPCDVMEDNRLDTADKIKILESWMIDMEGLMRAEEENMTKGKKPRYNADERFREIKECLRCLQENPAH